jgi:SAM-dependent methyltransferase
MGDERLTPSQVSRLKKELKLFDPFRKLNRLIEVGAGRGWLLAEAARIGWESWAVEINDSAKSRLAQLGLYRIISDPAESFDAPPGSFDAARMWDVIEHFESPKRAMERVYRILRPGGAIRLATTNYASLSRIVNGPEWVYINGADHIYLFEPATIKLLLETVGFADVRIRTRSFNMRRKLYHPEKTLTARPAALIPLRKIIDALIGMTDYGHQMIVHAIKPRQPGGF